MQGLTHVLGKAKLFITAFKVGGFTDLAAVFESHCSLCTCRGLLLKLCNLSYRLTWFFLFRQPQLDGTNGFSHGNDSRIIWLKILMIGHHKIFETTAFFHSFSVSFIRWLCRSKCPNDSIYIHLNSPKVDCLFVKYLINDSWILNT